MKKAKLMMVAAAAGSLLTATQGRAQVNYSPGDLLLNFRDINDTPPLAGTLSGVDLEVDVGPVTSLPTSGSEVLVSGGVVTGVFGSPASGNQVGLSATAETGYGNFTTTLYLTRQQTGTTPPTVASQAGQQTTEANEEGTALAIDNIGGGAATTLQGTTVTLTGSSRAQGASTVPASSSTSSYSYQAQGEANSSTAGQGSITFGGNESIVARDGGAIETIQNGSGNIYESLWEVPASDTVGGADTYLGYLTFQPNGEVDFTGSAVPEPSTYVLLLLTGVFGWVFRRQARSLVA